LFIKSFIVEILTTDKEYDNNQSHSKSAENQLNELNSGTIIAENKHPTINSKI